MSNAIEQLQMQHKIVTETRSNVPITPQLSMPEVALDHAVKRRRMPIGLSYI
jgi:hypothetical protein